MKVFTHPTSASDFFFIFSHLYFSHVSYETLLKNFKFACFSLSRAFAAAVETHSCHAYSLNHKI
jgi:hypothetical protein